MCFTLRLHTSAAPPQGGLTQALGRTSMPLDLAEILPGTVAILEAGPLIADPDVVYEDEQPGFRSGPFLCVSVDNEMSTWLHLTTKIDKRSLRLEIKQEWRLDGSDKWRGEPCYVVDARKPFIGPLRSFITAGAKELPHRPHKRPHVASDGLAAVLAEMGRYKDAP